jgi:hypothetical protein
MTLTPEPADGPWLNLWTEYEGERLALRVRPDADSPAARRAFPQFAAIEHALAEVRADGMPVAEYNHSLADFDHDVHDCVERDGDGLVVIVETFSGKRAHYAYVADGARLGARVEELRVKYPQHVLDVRGNADPQWRFYTQYRRQFPW